MAVKYDCVTCKKQVTATKNNRYRTHTTPQGDPCQESSVEIPEHILTQPVGEKDDPSVPREGVDYAPCGECGRGAVKLTRLGYYEPHNTTLRGGERCAMSGVRYRTERKVESPLLTEPGTSERPKKPDWTTPAANRGLAASAPTGSSTGGSAGARSAARTAPAPAESGASTSQAPAAGSAECDEEPGRGNLERQPMSAAPAVATGAARAGASGVPPTALATPVALASPATMPLSPGSTGTSGVSSGERAGLAPTSSDAPSGTEDPASAGPLSLAPHLDGSVLQPFSHFCQPFPVPQKVKLKEAMGEEAKERAARFREVFYSYSNRRSSDNRGAQKTLGPSQIGHECDRRLAMALMGVEPVNPGGDGWAAWLGTQGHSGLEQMFRWASANSGRFLTETRVRFESKYVPHGTADLFDRMLDDVGDFKFLGEYSLKKMIQEGPPEYYQVQLHVYGLGMELLGERVRTVTLYGLPRAGSSLEGMYVWSVPYDRKKAQAALARVDRIAAEAQAVTEPMHPDGQWSAGTPMEAAAEFEMGPAAECRFCPFHLKNDKEMRRGCPGK